MPEGRGGEGRERKASSPPLPWGCAEVCLVGREPWHRVLLVSCSPRGVGQSGLHAAPGSLGTGWWLAQTVQFGWAPSSQPPCVLWHRCSLCCVCTVLSLPALLPQRRAVRWEGGAERSTAVVTMTAMTIITITTIIPGHLSR